MPSTPGHTPRASPASPRTLPRVGTPRTAQGPGHRTALTFCRNAILGLYCWPWCRIVIPDPGWIQKQNRADHRRGSPGRRRPRGSHTPRRPGGGGRPGARGGGGCCRRRPFTLPRPPPRESRWNPRQPISAPRRGLISMRCACAHLPPGGGVWSRRDPAEPQVRPGSVRPREWEDLSQRAAFSSGAEVSYVQK